MKVWNWSTLTVAMQRKNNGKLVGVNIELSFTIYGKIHEKSKFLVIMKEDGDLQQALTFGMSFNWTPWYFETSLSLLLLRKMLKIFEVSCYSLFYRANVELML